MEPRLTVPVCTEFEDKDSKIVIWSDGDRQTIKKTQDQCPAFYS